MRAAEQGPRPGKRARLFLLVCALHGLLIWFLLATNRITQLSVPDIRFQLLVIAPTHTTLPGSNKAESRPATPRAVPRTEYRHRIEPEAPSDPEQPSNATYPSIDWDAELARAGTAASGPELKAPQRNFGFPAKPPTMADYPQFDWDYARTHRVETIPEGGVVIHLNDNCVLVLAPFPFPFCSPFKHKANGELFKHMRDPDRPGDARVP